MTDISIPGSQSTPEIRTDFESGTLYMRGDSYPENSFEFFREVIDWVERYLAHGDRALHFELRLIYMNTSSVKAMMDIFDMLEEAHEAGRAISVVWYYDPRNERVVDMAEEFQEDCSFDFRIEADEPA